MTNYELVRNKVIEAVPEILEKYEHCGWHTDAMDWKKCKQCLETAKTREIRLSDVLRAMGHNQVTGFFVDRHGDMEARGRVFKDGHWNLAQDSLEWHRDNRPQVIDFLAEILK